MLNTWIGIGTQWEGLGHLGIDNRYDNCKPGIDITGDSGQKKFGIETVLTVATRAVLLETTALMGKDLVPEGTSPPT